METCAWCGQGHTVLQEKGWIVSWNQADSFQTVMKLTESSSRDCMPALFEVSLCLRGHAQTIEVKIRLWMFGKSGLASPHNFSFSAWINANLFFIFSLAEVIKVYNFNLKSAPHSLLNDALPCVWGPMRSRCAWMYRNPALLIDWCRFQLSWWVSVEKTFPSNPATLIGVSLPGGRVRV